MTKTLLLATALLTTLFLSGCGESTNETSEKDKVIVLHDVGIAGCTLLENFGNSKLEEQDLVENTAYTSTNNDVSCSTYGKTRGEIAYENIDANIDIECAELTLDEIQEAFPKEDLSLYENKDKACILSFDLK